MSDEMSLTVASLFEALAAAQAELEGAKKGSVNPHFKNSYADMASVVEAGKKALPKHGLCVIQTTRANGKDGVTVITTLGHKSGEWIRGEMFMPSAKPDAQGLGSATTYARRYAYMAIVGIAPDDDDGNAAAQPEPPPQRGPIRAPATPADQLAPAMAQSVDMLNECVRLNEQLSKAPTMGELHETWARVLELKKAGLPNAHVASLTKMKDVRKSQLNGAA